MSDGSIWVNVLSWVLTYLAHSTLLLGAAWCLARLAGSERLRLQERIWKTAMIGGLGYSSPTPFDTPGEYTEEEMARQLEPFRVSVPLIMVCHCPPFGTELDRMSNDAHAGSRAIGEFIEECQPAAFFCGHIHEAHGVACSLGKTKAWNVGKLGVLLDFAKLEA